MKIYILSDCHGLVGYYATKELAIKAAKNTHKFDLEYASDRTPESFQDYWDNDCHLEVDELETEVEE